MSMSTMSMFTMPHHVHLVQHCSPGEAAGKEDKEQGARLEEGLEAGHHPGEEPSNEIAKAKTKSTSLNIIPIPIRSGTTTCATTPARAPS